MTNEGVSMSKCTLIRNNVGIHTRYEISIGKHTDLYDKLHIGDCAFTGCKRCIDICMQRKVNKNKRLIGYIKTANIYVPENTEEIEIVPINTFLDADTANIYEDALCNFKPVYG